MHFGALINVTRFKPGKGNRGAHPLEWLEHDLKSGSASQPIVVLTHIPLWQVYPPWGWVPKMRGRPLAFCAVSGRWQRSTAIFTLTGSFARRRRMGDFSVEPQD